MATHLRGTTGSGGWRAARLKPSADTTPLKLAQATISNTERSRQVLATEQERIRALAADLRTCRREQDTVLGLLQHAREQWTSIAEATENETDELQKSLREERLHTQRLERELVKARNDFEVRARLSREIGTEGREPERRAQSDPRELQQAVEREKNRANRLEQNLTAAHHDLETQSAEVTRQAQRSVQKRQRRLRYSKPPTGARSYQTAGGDARDDTNRARQPIPADREGNRRNGADQTNSGEYLG